MDQDADIFLAELDTATHATREQELLPQLAPEEQARYRSFGAEPRRQTWLAGRELLLTALARHRGDAEPQALLTKTSGGVHYARGAVHLNLSHSGGWLAAVVAWIPVGVDIEQLRPRAVTTQAARIFCDDETRWLERQTDPLGAFYTLWTLKEAACKAADLSMWDALRHACFDLDAGRGRLSPPFPAGAWGFMHLAFQPGWRLALALHGTSGAARIGCWRQTAGAWENVALHGAVHLASP